MSAAYKPRKQRRGEAITVRLRPDEQALFDTLSEVEKRSKTEILCDLITQRADALRRGAAGPDDDPGEVLGRRVRMLSADVQGLKAALDDLPDLDELLAKLMRIKDILADMDLEELNSQLPSVRDIEQIQDELKALGDLDELESKLPDVRYLEQIQDELKALGDLDELNEKLPDVRHLEQVGEAIDNLGDLDELQAKLPDLRQLEEISEKLDEILEKQRKIKRLDG